MRSKKTIAILLVVALVSGYVAAYGLARTQHYLIHTTELGSHVVRRGDCGWDMMGNPHPKIASVCFYVFTPLRWLEAKHWEFRA